jgi:hypothetical protein
VELHPLSSDQNTVDASSWPCVYMFIAIVYYSRSIGYLKCNERPIGPFHSSSQPGLLGGLLVDIQNEISAVLEPYSRTDIALGP